MQHFHQHDRQQPIIAAAMSHNDLFRLQTFKRNQRLMMPSTPSPPPLPPPTSPITPPPLLPLTTTIATTRPTAFGYLRGRDRRTRIADTDEDIERIIAETTFMQPNIATTKVYSDHEIDYSSRYHETTSNNNNNNTTTTTTTNNIPRTTLASTMTTTIQTPERFDQPIRDTLIGRTTPTNETTTTAVLTNQQTLQQQEQHLYHTL